MHNNYYFLQHISRFLETTLSKAVVSECFSQSKEELILRFETKSSSFVIRATLQPDFSCVSFPENFHRARKNSVDLFPEIIGQRVEYVKQFLNERSFAIRFENNLSLVFKMHGNRSNVILFRDNILTEIFRNKIAGDNTVQLQLLDRAIDWSYETFEKHHEKPAGLYFTFGKIVWSHLRGLQYEEKTIKEKWSLIQDVKKQLESGSFFIITFDGKPALSLIPFGVIRKIFEDPIQAVNEFYYSFTHTFVFEKEKNSLLISLRGKQQGNTNYYTKALAKFNDLEHDSKYKIWADLIMANMYDIQPGAASITVKNFYKEDEPLTIKLKKDLSAQKNAEVYYKKSKNQQLELDHLSRLLQEKKDEIENTQTFLTKIEQTTDLKSLRELLVQSAGENVHEAKEGKALPYHEFEHGGFRIWVGKNAKSNDILTLKFGYKEDLWLHAKDVPGSHVLIKYQSGKNFPKDVIERAAQLAAFNSKRKNESLCPVIVTPKKYVRKRKGDPPGAVIVEREDVMMVEPKH